MSDGGKVDVSAAIARKGYFDARVRLARDLDGGVEARVDHVAGRFQAAKPASVNGAARSRLEQLNDFAAHALGHFQRRNREVELDRATLADLHEQPKKNANHKSDFGPGLKLMRICVFINLTMSG